MPSEHMQSQAQTRPALGDRRSTDSVHRHGDSPAGSPPQQHGKPKAQKHVVHAGRTHTRVPSNRALHKLTKAHGNEGSLADLKKLGKNSSSATNLKKNSSHVSLKRNRSSADVPKRPKSSGEGTKRPTSVHFEIGDQEDAWEEASSSASPALSRASRSGQSSAKPSASNSQAHSPVLQSPSLRSHLQSTNDGGPSRPQSTDAKVITERLLNRTPSLSSTTTKMSLATATPAGHSPPSPRKSQASTLNGTPKSSKSTREGELISRFVGSSEGTPSDNSPFLHSHHRRSNSSQPQASKDEPKRAQSMGNLTRADSDDSESALKPRSQKPASSSAQQHPYNPPQQSRTQQKLWLQRASSNIEPTNNGVGLGIPSAALYDGRDPRIKSQLERTGLEYLVVRRFQDPVGAADKRLEKLPGAEKYRRIPPQGGVGGARKENRAAVGGGGGSYQGRARARSSYEEQSVGSADSGTPVGHEDEGVEAILRSMWEKSYDLSASQD